MKNVMNNAVLIGVVGLVLGFVLGWMLGNSGDTLTRANTSTAKEKSNVSTTTTTTNVSGIIDALTQGSSPSAEGEAKIVVSNQKTGSVVTVSSVAVDASAWVAVREDSNGIVGNILGARRVDQGETKDVQVVLLRSTEAGKTYRVVLFKDNGDKEFDYKTDSPMTSGGALISEAFTAE